MKAVIFAFSAFSALTLSVPATAGRLPGPTHLEGPNCAAVAKASGLDTLYVGTVLGGRITGHRWGDGTMRDYKTWQGCFVSLERCTAWVAERAAVYTQPPGYARCTRVLAGQGRP